MSKSPQGAVTLVIMAVLLLTIPVFSVAQSAGAEAATSLSRAEGPDCPRDSSNLGTPVSENSFGPELRRPVVYVHGWTSGPGTWTGTASSTALPKGVDNPAEILKQRTSGRTENFFFDYAGYATWWAAIPDISACLGEYITQIGSAYKQAGGDGKVIVIAHSMGGLATLYSSSSEFARHPSGEYLGGMITFDTPYLGSSWATGLRSWAAKGLEFIKLMSAEGSFPPAESDAAYCLGIHTNGDDIPSPCNHPLAPQLPAAVPLTTIQGDITVDRQAFSAHLYDLNTFSDGIVPVDSQKGYSEAYRTVLPKGAQVDTSRRVDCKIGTGDLNNASKWLALTLGPGVAAGWGLGGSTLRSFSDMLSDIEHWKDDSLNGQDRSADLQQSLTIGKAVLAASCSHINILHHEGALNIAAEALNGYIDQLGLVGPGSPTSSALPPTFWGVWEGRVNNPNDGTSYLTRWAIGHSGEVVTGRVELPEQNCWAELSGGQEADHSLNVIATVVEGGCGSAPVTIRQALQVGKPFTGDNPFGGLKVTYNDNKSADLIKLNCAPVCAVGGVDFNSQGQLVTVPRVRFPQGPSLPVEALVTQDGAVRCGVETEPTELICLVSDPQFAVSYCDLHGPGPVVWLGADEAPDLAKCVTDDYQVNINNPLQLGTGSLVRIGGVQCTAEESSKLICLNSNSAGFVLSKDAYIPVKDGVRKTVDLPHLKEFTTQDGNIGCVDPDSYGDVACFIRQHEFAVPNVGCNAQSIAYVYTNNTEQPQMNDCNGDVLLGHNDIPKVPGGTTVEIAGVSCLVSDGNITCTNYNGVGFSLDKAFYTEVNGTFQLPVSGLLKLPKPSTTVKAFINPRQSVGCTSMSAVGQATQNGVLCVTLPDRFPELNCAPTQAVVLYLLQRGTTFVGGSCIDVEDLAQYPPMEPVADGTVAGVDSVVCKVEEELVSCTNPENHGFTMAPGGLISF